jgi:hypothetical protein
MRADGRFRARVVLGSAGRLRFCNHRSR